MGKITMSCEWMNECERQHIVRTWGYDFHCPPLSSQFWFQHHSVWKHNSPLCWWLWQRWLHSSAASRHSTMDCPHCRQCGCRTPGCRKSPVSHQWPWRQQRKGGLMTGWRGPSGPHWDKGKLGKMAQRAGINASLWYIVCQVESN